MNCPICGKTIIAGTDRCPDCGYLCRPAANTTAIPTSGYTFPEPEKPSRLKTCGCCLGVFAGVLLIFALTALSLAAVFSFSDFGVIQREPEYPMESILPDYPDDPDDPDYEEAEEASEDCFSIRSGAVTFREEAWDGGTVLQIPETVAGERVTALAPGCFRGCETLTTIILPESVTKIDRAAFDGCTNLRGLFVPEGCTSIAGDVFDGCVSMEAIYIPASMESIAPGTFDDCAALRLIFYSGDYDVWCSLYGDFITPFTAAICLDGSYYHATP